MTPEFVETTHCDKLTIMVNYVRFERLFQGFSTV